MSPFSFEVSNRNDHRKLTMDWKQFFAALASALAWPTALIVVVLLLRTPLSKIIPKIQSFKFGDLHIDLGKELDALKEKVIASSPPESQPAESSPPPPPSILELAASSPRSAILMAWLDVERELNKLATKHGIAPAKTPVSTANLLHIEGVLDESTFTLFRELRAIRNEAAHLGTREIEFSDAVSMAEMCQWLLQSMQGGFPKGSATV